MEPVEQRARKELALGTIDRTTGEGVFGFHPIADDDDATLHNFLLIVPEGTPVAGIRIVQFNEEHSRAVRSFMPSKLLAAGVDHADRYLMVRREYRGGAV